MESSFQLNKEIRIFVENLKRKNMARNKRFVWEKQQSGLLKEVSIFIILFSASSSVDAA